ncbi:hypothetical protein [Pseudoclavibacter sp. VKM Ac-2888]|uniref:hypothetical protein n=1 Tax=Pseudoclavibacter sp. VKM Ac-2888 TaxID=2783830 RepID=UPI00188B6092|nr:hypothetical protein [Pseudoclavibacter sp. VKM Ac-2888]MBF4549453.1 hypothetical protein [Pseudoclavibacter sp. VKM Ac-2888]
MSESGPIIELYERTKMDVLPTAHLIAAMGHGADYTDQHVGDAIKRILESTMPGSNIDRIVRSLDFEAAKVVETKTFVGTVIHVDRDLKSQRGIVILKTSVHPKHNKLGQDLVRSDRLDGPKSEAVSELMKQTLALVGHKVAVTVNMVASKDGDMKYRVLAGLEDRGVDPAYNAGNPEYQVKPEHRGNQVDLRNWAQLRNTPLHNPHGYAPDIDAAQLANLPNNGVPAHMVQQAQPV